MTWLITLVGILFSIYWGMDHDFIHVLWLPVFFLPQMWTQSHDLIMFKIDTGQMGSATVHIFVLPYLWGLVLAGAFFGIGAGIGVLMS